MAITINYSELLWTASRISIDKTMHFYFIRYYSHTDFIAVEVNYFSRGFNIMGSAGKVFL